MPVFAVTSGRFSCGICVPTVYVRSVSEVWLKAGSESAATAIWKEAIAEPPCALVATYSTAVLPMSAAARAAPVVSFRVAGLKLKAAGRLRSS